MTKLLLLGKNGLLGTELALALASKYELHAPNRSKLDLTDTMAVERYLDQIRPKIVVNATAYSAVEAAETTDSGRAHLINGEVVGQLAQLCAKRGILLVHYSTDYVFDGRSPTGYAENAKPNPLNEYGRSKLLGEELLKAVGGDYLLIRTSWLFGHTGRSFVHTMLELAKTKAEVQVVADQIGCPTYAPDLAQATADLLTKESTGIYHLTNSDPVSWAEFAKEIFALAGLPTKVVEITSSQYSSPVQRPLCSILLNTKTPPLRSWRPALDEYLEYRKNVKYTH